MAQDTFDLLQKIVDETTCFPGWSFKLIDEEGAKRLVITIETVSNYDTEKPFVVLHFHPVPPATYNKKSWQRWIFDQCMRTHVHETGEALRFGGKRPFAHCHGPGEDPYALHDNRTDEELRTMQDGSIRAKSQIKTIDGIIRILKIYEHEEDNIGEDSQNMDAVIRNSLGLDMDVPVLYHWINTKTCTSYLRGKTYNYIVLINIVKEKLSQYAIDTLDDTLMSNKGKYVEIEY